MDKSKSTTQTRRALLWALGGGAAMALWSNPVGAGEAKNTPLEMHENIDAEENGEDIDQEQKRQYPTPECKVIRPTDHGRRKMPSQ